MSASNTADRWPERSLHLNYSHPLNSEMTTTVTYDLVEGFGKISDLAGVGLGGDRHLVARLGLTLFSTYANWFVTANSHEFAHPQEEFFKGCDADYRFRWFDRGLLVPIVVSNGKCGVSAEFVPPSVLRGFEYRLVESSFEGGDVRGSVEGINQQQRNARFLFEQNSERGSMTYDEGIAYLMNQGADLAYQATTPFVPPEKKINENLTYVNDIHGFENNSKGNNLQISRGRWIAGSLLTTALSGRTWESFRASGRYLASGEREVDVVRFSLGNESTFSFPDLALYAYQGGFYVDGELPIQNLLASGETLYLRGGGGGPLLGGDRVGHAGLLLTNWAPFGQRGYFPKLRLGGTITYSPLTRQLVGSKTTIWAMESEQHEIDDITVYYNWPHWEAVRDPHLGFGLEGGVSFGSEGLQVGARFLYLHKDMMRNVIQGLPQGLSIIVGTQIPY